MIGLIVNADGIIKLEIAFYKIEHFSSIAQKKIWLFHFYFSLL